MFNIFTDAIDNALGVGEDIGKWLVGEDDGPSRKSVAKLIDSGLTIAAIAAGFGVAESVIEGLLEDMQNE